MNASLPTSSADTRPTACSRRLALRAGSALLASIGLVATGLSGCGFQLRTAPRMAFRTVALTGFASNSPMATELARALEATGVDVVEDSAQAAAAASQARPSASASAPGASAAMPASSPLAGHVILEALTDTRDQVVASSTAFGQVRDLTLRTRFTFRLLASDGAVLIPTTDLALSRDLTYNERDALAKQDESDALHRAMQTDLVAQVLRRCAVVRPDQLARP